MSFVSVLQGSGIIQLNATMQQTTKEIKKT
jgi:hypothetical protein